MMQIQQMKLKKLLKCRIVNLITIIHIGKVLQRRALLMKDNKRKIHKEIRKKAIEIKNII